MNIFILLKKLIYFTFKSKKGILILFTILSIFSAFAEVLTIGSVIPYLTAIINPEALEKSSLIKSLSLSTGINLIENIFYYASILFILIILVATILKLLLLVLTINLTKTFGYTLSTSVLRNVLRLSYVDITKNNNNEIIASATSKTDTSVNYLFNGLNIISSTIILLITTIFLLIITLKISFLAFTFFLILYLGISRIFGPTLNASSKKVSNLTTVKIKTLREILGSFKEIIIYEAQSFFLNFFERNEINYRNALVKIDFISRSPRIILEAFAIMTIAFLSLFIMNNDNYNSLNIITTLGIIAFGAAKILPLMQGIYASWSQMSGSYNSVLDVYNYLEIDNKNNIKEINKVENLTFENHIKINNINFRFKKKNIFNNLSLTFNKNKFYGIYGSTGSGKSTLIDLILGLRTPTTGTVDIDKENITNIDIKEWYKKIAYLPQEIFLLNSDIKENIVFNVPKTEINYKKLNEIVKKSQLAEFIESKKEGLSFEIGENGRFISGGQKQRLGIARALYKDAELLIFDESTSALDSNTEKKIIEHLISLKKEKTIIFVTHKENLREYFDEVIDIDKI